MYSAGRSAGWLIVTGISDPDEWDGVMLNRWALFERAVKAEVEYRTSTESILEDIAANQWAHDQQALEADVADALPSPTRFNMGDDASPLGGGA